MKLIIATNSIRYDVTKFSAQITWSGDYQSCCRKLEFDLLSSQTDKSIPVLRCEIMDTVMLYGDSGKLLFYGNIWARDKTTGSSFISITCYDRGFYLKRISASYRFSGSSPKTIVKRLCKDYGIPTGSIADPNYKVKRNFFGKTLYDIIQTAYTLAGQKKGKKYQLIFRGKSLYVEEKKKEDRVLIVKGGVNLMDASISESAEKVVTRVKIYDQKDKFVKNVDDKEAIKTYGILQSYLKQTKDDNKKEEAQEILKENQLEQKITVNMLGNESCITGEGVVVKEPYTGINGYFYIDADVHTWKNGQYYNKLTLNFKNIMDEKEAGTKPE